MSLDPIQQKRSDDLRYAIRALLRQPLILRAGSPDEYDAVRRSLNEVESWFLDTAGWRVEHDRPAGLVRLHKVPARVDETRAPAPEFGRRHYVLLCLLLAELDRAGRQVTLKSLADRLRDATVAEEEIDAFDSTVHDERRTFVHVVRWLTDRVGVLSRRDGDEETFLRSGSQGDALYDVDDRALATLIAAPRSPSAVGSPEDLTRGFYADTDEGRRRRHAHDVYRRLLDDPVLYFEDLPPDARDWFFYSLRRIGERLAEAGLVLERRAEGVAAIDPDGQISDQRFPVANSTRAHVALLLAEWLAHARTARHADVVQRVSDWQTSDHGKKWRKETPREITEEALDLLSAFQLVSLDGDRVHARPAIARFRAAQSEETVT